MLLFIASPRDDAPLCAVVGCRTAGRPQVCPYDGRYHHHGRIHYECHTYKHNDPGTELRFRKGAWHLMCDEHYAQIMAELPPKSRCAS